jgi:hypothetical protein
VSREQILAFRLARSGLVSRDATSLAAAAACPASDFSRNAALLALAARMDGVTREGYDAAIEDGSLLLAHVHRGAIHALDPRDHALYGRALLADTDAELGPQLGRQVQGLTDEPVAALEEVAAATADALKDGPLDKVELHAELRQRVRPELMPWCRTCASHHVAPMLWRYATVKAGARMDAERRYVPGDPGPTPPATDAVRRYLHFYAPGTASEFAEWAGVTKPHAKRLWASVELDDGVLPEDVTALESPPDASGVRLLPPGDPYLQKPNRPLLAPEPELRKRLFRPVASPGVVLKDGRLVGMWKTEARGGTLRVVVEKLGRFALGDLEEEAWGVAAVRGASSVVVVER